MVMRAEGYSTWQNQRPRDIMAKGNGVEEEVGSRVGRGKTSA